MSLAYVRILSTNHLITAAHEAGGILWLEFDCDADIDPHFPAFEDHHEGEQP